MKFKLSSGCHIKNWHTPAINLFIMDGVYISLIVLCFYVTLEVYK